MIININKKFAALGAGAALLLSTAGSCGSGGSANKLQTDQQTQTETAFAQQQAAVPFPVTQLLDSTERRNLRERLLRFNKPNRLGYVYIFNFGKVEGYYTINGKISSTDSQMTSTDLITQNQQDNGQTAVLAPSDDGSYGPNEKGVFFFTTEGALIETSLDHLYSDQPIPIYAAIPKLNGTGAVSDLSARK